MPCGAIAHIQSFCPMLILVGSFREPHSLAVNELNGEGLVLCCIASRCEVGDLKSKSPSIPVLVEACEAHRPCLFARRFCLSMMSLTPAGLYHRDLSLRDMRCALLAAGPSDWEGPRRSCRTLRSLTKKCRK